MSEMKGNLQILPVNSKVFFPFSQIRAKFPIETEKAIQLGSYIGLVFSIPKQDSNLFNKIIFKDGFTKVGVIVKLAASQTFMFNTNGIYSEAIVISGQIVSRFEVVSYKSTGKLMNAEINLFNDENDPKIAENENLKKIVEIVKSGIIDRTILSILEEEGDFQRFSFQLAETLQLSNLQKMILLQESSLEERFKFLFQLLKDFSTKIGFEKKLDIHLSNKISEKRKKAAENLREIISKNKPIFSRENPISTSSNKNESLANKIENSKMPEDLKTKLQDSLKSIGNSPDSSFSSITRNHIESVLTLPWNESVEERGDILKAEEILERDHFGLEKVKRRIVEFLAVKFMNGNSKGSIICFQGPPGVGKTSLGKSIAEALGRPFARVSLGGVKDEAEIRGHRRTYVGAYPGIIIQSLIQAGKDNPVILLDEVDKLTRGINGDPSSALLEVLDPAQNHKFKDHYIDYPFDLSKVFFIATSNSLETIQRPLLDRMEVIELPGYTLEEKIQIAKKYLVARQLKENGLEKAEVEFSEKIIETIIKSYTLEPGVRELERCIASICRDICLEFMKLKQKEKGSKQIVFPKVKVCEERMKKALGFERILENGILPIAAPGIAFGLAWTPAGGKVLTVESSLSLGKGEIQITGQLGEVMKESVLTALAWIKSNEKRILFSFPEIGFLDSKKSLFEQIDINIHFPAASTPKDGPSAGITILTALVSLLSNVKVRSDVSMTGEISLQGRVLPIGGLKEKSLASLAAGIKRFPFLFRIIVPDANRNNVLELSNEVKKELK